MLAKEDGYVSSPVLAAASILIVLLGLQAGAWFLGRDAANVAAQAAYTNARAYQSDANTGIAMADQLLARTGFLRDPQVTVDRTADTVTVTVTGKPASLIPFVELPAITRTLTGPVERWVPKQ